MKKKNHYISFGQIHTHSINGITIDKDCIVEFENMTYEEARAKAFKLFGAKFCFVYEKKPDMEFFPRGIIKL